MTCPAAESFAYSISHSLLLDANKSLRLLQGLKTTTLTLEIEWLANFELDGRCWGRCWRKDVAADSAYDAGEAVTVHCRVGETSSSGLSCSCWNRSLRDRPKSTMVAFLDCGTHLSDLRQRSRDWRSRTRAGCRGRWGRSR